MMFSRSLLIIISVLSLTLVSCSNNNNSSQSSDEGNNEKKVRWKMASTFAGNLTQLGSSGVRFSNQIEVISGGNIKVKFFDPGALVPALEIFDAVSSGSIDAEITISEIL